MGPTQAVLTITAFPLPAGLLAALREHAEENGETLADVMRRAALTLLGACPTCGQPAPKDPAPKDPGAAAAAAWEED